MEESNLASKLRSIVKSKVDGEVSDYVSVYIGVSLLSLGLLNGITDVPDPFIIGATLSGLFFTMTELVTMHEKFKKLYVPLIGMGIFSIFLLPIFLMVFSNSIILELFKMFSDMGTFTALGFVMIALGVKSGKAKNENMTILFEVIEDLVDENGRLVNENGQTKHDLIILEREYKEHMEDYQIKIANFEEELKNVKEISNANRLKDFSKI